MAAMVKFLQKIVHWKNNFDLIRLQTKMADHIPFFKYFFLNTKKLFRAYFWRANSKLSVIKDSRILEITI